jgi:hypothetical protein
VGSENPRRRLDAARRPENSSNSVPAGRQQAPSGDQPSSVIPFHDTYQAAKTLIGYGNEKALLF